MASRVLKTALVALAIAVPVWSILSRPAPAPRQQAPFIEPLPNDADIVFWQKHQQRQQRAAEFDRQELLLRQQIGLAKSPEHEAGYAWALQYAVGDIDKCDGTTRAFIEGCMEYASEHEPALHIDGPTAGDEY